jgi:pimeloyl-ACP methyl ester carboxylesterase
VSQRGTMFSEPALTCAPNDQFNRELLGLRFYSEATKRAHLAATEACHRELTATGADLSAYNSTENAADFADLRRALGLPTWNVYGTSYGSYVAQTLMRDNPEGIRSVVLDSVLPTSYTIPGNWWITRAAFDNLFQACVAETACNAAHQHLEKTFIELVNKFEAEPLTTTVRDPVTGKDLKVVLDGGALVDWLRNQNYAVPLLRAAPDLIGGLAAGRPEAIETGSGGHRHQVQAYQPSATDCPLASPAAKTTRSRLRKISRPPAGKRSPTIRPQCKMRASAAGRMSTKTAMTSGRFLQPQWPCASLSRAPSQHFSSRAASIR